MSRAIEALKTVNERLPHNHTSYQLLSVLDSLLWKAVAPILKTTGYADRLLSSILYWMSVTPRRKISTLDKAKLNTYFMAFLLASNHRTKLRILKRMRLERNIIFYMCSSVIDTCGTMPIGRPSPEMIDRFCVRDHDTFWYAVRESAFWHEQALKFKSMILEKYMRLVVVEAQSFFKKQSQDNPELTFDLSEIAQNFFLAANKAVDKCDVTRGTLTSYIGLWIKEAKGNPALRGQYGIAYSVPASQRRLMALGKAGGAVNISSSVDSEELAAVAGQDDVAGEYERRQLVDFVRRLAKEVDPRGFGRMALGIAEVLD